MLIYKYDELQLYCMEYKWIQTMNNLILELKKADEGFEMTLGKIESTEKDDSSPVYIAEKHKQ